MENQCIASHSIGVCLCVLGNPLSDTLKAGHNIKLESQRHVDRKAEKLLVWEQPHVISKA